MQTEEARLTRGPKTQAESTQDCQDFSCINSCPWCSHLARLSINGTTLTEPTHSKSFSLIYALWVEAISFDMLRALRLYRKQE